MRIEPPKKRRFLFIAPLVAIIAATGGFLLWQQPHNEQPLPQVNVVDYGPATEEQKNEGMQIKKASIEPTKPTSDLLTVSITRAGQIDSQVSVASMITPSSTGTCEVRFTKDSVQFTKVTDVVTDMGARCLTTVPVSEFSVDGQWNVTVVAKNNTGLSEPATSTFEVKK